MPESLSSFTWQEVLADTVSGLELFAGDVKREGTEDFLERFGQATDEETHCERTYRGWRTLPIGQVHRTGHPAMGRDLYSRDFLARYRHLAGATLRSLAGATGGSCAPPRSSRTDQLVSTSTSATAGDSVVSRRTTCPPRLSGRTGRSAFVC